MTWIIWIVVVVLIFLVFFIALLIIDELHKHLEMEIKLTSEEVAEIIYDWIRFKGLDTETVDNPLECDLNILMYVECKVDHTGDGVHGFNIFHYGFNDRTDGSDVDIQINEHEVEELVLKKLQRFYND